MNFGCPATRRSVHVPRHGLAAHLPVVKRILPAIRKAVSIPFTCKFRTGWDDKSIIVRQMGQLAEDCGLQGVSLHGRTRQQGYSGAANWDLIADLKQSVNIPVIGNGDVFSPEDCVRMFTHTGCDGVMIGRAASTNPWIFSQIRQYIASGKYEQPTQQQRYEMLRDYYQLLLSESDKISGTAVRLAESVCDLDVTGHAHGAELRKGVCLAHVLLTM
ncbi:tRNA-dihydrouridine synthase B [Geodia barretti]|uniref:tRNA-dihydrouridine(47) synthase [NAD(P)(+)] n=1 Tax=Geodia barretti TaxID=519541 RepID=A0AA35X0K8_GEOBA|nr:tRNA-dihydrouridine synthase B [Geodia barretti]